MGKTLIICEKPAAASKVAEALAEGKPKKQEFGTVPYFQFKHDEKEMVIVPALGHLFTLKNKRPMRDYPFYDIDWVPIYQASKKAERSRQFVEVIKKLAEDADEWISATDYDIEGAVIAYNILKYLCGEKAVEQAKRMKFSTLTAQDLRESYENILPRLDFEQINAGLARHVLDWYWGQNLSKAMSASVEAVHQRFVKLSAGRVQTPTLKILATREQKIKAFKPKPFWVISLLLKLGKKEILAEHVVPRFFNKSEAEQALTACNGKPCIVVGIQTRRYRRPPPAPFDLGTLQSEAYRCFGYTPMRTQQLAQQLYQMALISYPRTSSQKLPPTICYASIIKKLGEISEAYKKMSEELLSFPELRPKEGPKSDPAHPSIFPTGEKPGWLSGPQQKLYDLIVRRFFSVFGKSALLESIRVDLSAGGQHFFIRGRRILEKGWLNFYGRYGTTEEVILPQLKEGEEIPIKEVRFEEKETEPPPRYNPASIIKEMESLGLGTKTTRAYILQHLYERNYIFGSQIQVTELGMEAVDALEKYCSEIVSEELTAHFEREMELIQEEKRDKNEVIAEARAELNKILKKFREHQPDIGKVLGEAYKRTRQERRIVGKCPKCGGDLKIIVSRRTHKRFVGCSNYVNGCRTSFPLPQVGAVIPLGKTCEQCGTPIIQVSRIGTRPYRMCLDPNCSSKAGWGKKRAPQELKGP